MATVNDALLSQLHPSIISTINAVDADYVSSVGVSTLFCADTFECGIDNKTQYVSTKNEFISKFGEPNLNKFGQGAYNVVRWLEAGGDAQILRVLPDDAKYAHAIINIKVKKDNEKKVLSSTSDLININNIKIKPLIGYTLVNNINNDLLINELTIDRTNFDSIDEYKDYFIMLVKPNGRGEYYNKFGFRITPNPSFDSLVDSRIYNFETVSFDESGSYSIIEGPFFVSFDPDSLSESNESMFIEDVVNKYSQYVTVNFSTEQYLKLANIINPYVNPYSLDIITGKTRIINGEKETFYCEDTGKNEDVHLFIQSYDYKGEPIFNSDGENVLNISNYNSDSELTLLENDNIARQYNYNNLNEKLSILKSNFNDSTNFKTEIKKLIKTFKFNNDEKACSIIDDSLETSINNDLFNFSNISFGGKLKPIGFNQIVNNNYKGYFFVYYNENNKEAYIIEIYKENKIFKAKICGVLNQDSEFDFEKLTESLSNYPDPSSNNQITEVTIESFLYSAPPTDENDNHAVMKQEVNSVVYNKFDKLGTSGSYQTDITNSIIKINNIKKIDASIVSGIELNSTLMDNLMTNIFYFFKDLTTKNKIERMVNKLNQLKVKINNKLLTIEDEDEINRINGIVNGDNTNSNLGIDQILNNLNNNLKDHTNYLSENTILYFKSLLNKAIKNNESILEKINKLTSYSLVVDEKDIETNIINLKNTIKNNNFKLKNKISLFNEIYTNLKSVSLELATIRQSIVSSDKLSDTKNVLSKLFNIFENINSFDLNNEYSQNYMNLIYENIFESNGDYKTTGYLIDCENLINDLYFTEDDNKYLIYNEIYNKMDKIIELYDLINKIEIYNDSFEIICGFSKEFSFDNITSCRVYRKITKKASSEAEATSTSEQKLLDNDDITTDDIYEFLFNSPISNNEILVEDKIGITTYDYVESNPIDYSTCDSSYITFTPSINLIEKNDSILNTLGMYDGRTNYKEIVRCIKSFINITNTNTYSNSSYPNSELLHQFMSDYETIIRKFNSINSGNNSDGKTLKEIIKSSIDDIEILILQEKTNYYNNNLQNFNLPIKFLNGSDGSISKEYKNNSITKKNLLIKAYSGLIDEDVINKDLLQFDHILDANYDNSIKLAIADLARNVRKDFFFWCDTGYTSSPQDCLNWRKNNFNVYTQYMGIFSQDFVYYDTFTAKDCKFTSSYVLANKVPSVIFNNGIQYPIAGPRRGSVDGFKSINWIPNESYKELLYRQKINYIEKDSRRTKIGSQLTALDKNNPLSNINNMLVLLNIKKNVESIVANYQFEFNDTVTHNAMTYDLNEFLARYVENRSCESITSTVSATEYEKKQKIVRVSVVIKFNNVIERIVVSFDVAV